MNRLILLGNGFDLAHGLKTSYNDFILWYLITSMEEAQDKGEYLDSIISIHKNSKYVIHHPPDIKNVVKSFYREGKLDGLFNTDSVISYELNGTSKYIALKTVVHTEFMKSLFSDCTIQNWVDIENKYYSALKNILNQSSDDINVKDQLQQLHLTMEVLIKNLQKYLKTQKIVDSVHGFDRIFDLKLDENEFVHWDKVEKKELEKTLILNFNYTPTVEKYTLVSRHSNEAINVNYIHGQLNDSGNPIIFGFGDELDDHYKKLEDHPTKGIFKHIKSFGYFKTRNYHNLIRYIESGQFQVIILGHSCGLSDRTMLNMIFEHDNCMSIKIYYHQIDSSHNNFTELTEEISRHFKNKAKMRDRIVPFEDCKEMPQVR